MINNRDISIVVQGPIAGLPCDKYTDRYTHICLCSIRNILPGATIILSTWEGSNVEGLDYDELVISKDPGVSRICDNPNGFRQIVSSINGLRRVKTKYAMKARPDLLFKNDNFLRYFLQFNKLLFSENYRILKQRVVVFPATNPHRGYKLPFHGSDWLFFGLTEDVQNIFDVPIDYETWLSWGKDREKVSLGEEALFTNEQYIWLSFLGKYQYIPFQYMEDLSNDNIATSEKYFANNCIFLTGEKMGIDWLKHPGKSYAQIPCLSSAGIYTQNEYKNILNQYANNKLVIFPNPAEKAVFYIVHAMHRLRIFLKKNIPALHGFIASFFKKWVRRREDAIRVESIKVANIETEEYK